MVEVARLDLASLESVTTFAGALLAASEGLRTLREAHEVGVAPQEVKRHQHPLVGRLELHCQTPLDPHQSHRLLSVVGAAG